MKGSEKVIAALNKTLQEEFTALSQYFIHAEMCQNWEYNNLSSHLKKVSIVEMKHAEKTDRAHTLPGRDSGYDRARAYQGREDGAGAVGE